MNIKFDFNVAENIRDDYFYKGISRKEISAKYNISLDTISQIILNRSYKISEEDNDFYIEQLSILKSKKKIVSNKICTKCNVDKEIIFFNRESSWCKSCLSEYKKEYAKINKAVLSNKSKLYYNENKKDILQRVKNYNSKNKENKKVYDLKRYNENREEVLSDAKIYYKNNKIAFIDRGKKLSNKKYKTDPLFKLRNRLSSEIRKALKKNNSSKRGHSILEYLPYSIQELKEHLEKQFEPWMTWKNQGQYRIDMWDDNDQSTWKWQLDHIMPQSDLSYISMEDDNFKKCWNLSNLRPYSAKLNILDGTSRIRHKIKEIK